jgi:hypothetical protein
MAMDQVPGVVGALTDAVGDLQALDLDALSAEEAMGLCRAVEVVRRRLDAGTDRLAGHLDDTAKHVVDGHRTAKAALAHLVACLVRRPLPACARRGC